VQLTTLELRFGNCAPGVCQWAIIRRGWGSSARTDCTKTSMLAHVRVCPRRPWWRGMMACPVRVLSCRRASHGTCWRGPATSHADDSRRSVGGLTPSIPSRLPRDGWIGVTPLWRGTRNHS